MIQNIGGIIEEAATRRDPRAIARCLSLIEEGVISPFIDFIQSSARRAHVVGITGAPGVGKSSLINRILGKLREKGLTAAVLGIDPSSPISGGAFLGNRVRITVTDEGVFYRSLSTPPERSLPFKAYIMIEFLSAIGFDFVFIETPGAGQVNVDISNVADTTVVVLQPLTGDDIQVLKAGILEIGDIYVVNKSDLPQIHVFVEYLKMYLLDKVRDGWNVKLITTNALNGAGVEDLVKTIVEHKQFLVDRGLYFDKLVNRRSAIVSAFIREVVDSAVSMVEKKFRESGVGLEFLKTGKEKLLEEFSTALRDVVARYK